MNAAELKLKILSQVDSVDETRLQELYGVLMNFINGQKDSDDWVKLSDAQKNGIEASIKELDLGNGIAHEKVIGKFRDKYSNA